MIKKPTVFFSHSSLDSELVGEICGHFRKQTSDAIDVFLSSDGESIPLGKEWNREIIDALGRTDIMFVFVTPNSIRSKWIYFEAGHARGRDVDVVPIGLQGVNVNEIPWPLAQLQGFNITDGRGLNNLLKKVNKHFATNYSLFTASQTQKVLAKVESLRSQAEWAEHVRHFHLSVPTTSWKTSDLKATYLAVKVVLDELGIDSILDERFGVMTHGMLFKVKFGERMAYFADEPNVEPPEALNCVVDTAVAADSFLSLKQIVAAVAKWGISDSTFSVVFEEHVNVVDQIYRVAGRITETRLLDTEWLQFDDVKFQMVKSGTSSNLVIRLEENVNFVSITRLIERLFESGVLRI